MPFATTMRFDERVPSDTLLSMAEIVVHEALSPSMSTEFDPSSISLPTGYSMY